MFDKLDEWMNEPATKNDVLLAWVAFPLGVVLLAGAIIAILY